ncbi:lysine-specific demethylase phf2-like [Manduca sexta]|uniref:lysine-specific demethylase phf2-like n=1 Tax=Manduca sexta TaxID=7130 RepID=UPI00188F5EF3|nr:lysine-specific demethylase phf2-like [Manduca sexta]
MSKTMEEYVCPDCRRAEETQELYCLCRQPYDNSQFYICCDRCQDWFHGRCVGILQSEADNIDEYICPNCQKNNSVNFANMKELTPKEKFKEACKTNTITQKCLAFYGTCRSKRGTYLLQSYKGTNGSADCGTKSERTNIQYVK